jgi:glycosyltransferase involved in cell wall biosynthesis
VTEPVSVLLPVRDGKAIVAMAISDIAKALDTEDELLVIDDGSTDGTPELLNNLSKTVKQLRVVTTQGLGLVGALSLGIREAHHPWIARADADDRYPLDRLVRQRVACAVGVAAIVGDYRVTGPDEVGTIPCALGSPFVALSLVHPQRFPHPGVMFHRNAVLEAGGYRADEYPAEDLGLWMRLAQVGDLVGVPNVVVDWRMNPTSVSHSSQTAQRAMTAKLLSSFALPQAREITADDVVEELEKYKGTEHSFERAVLLARDLWAGRRLGVRSSALRPVFAHLGLRPGSSLRALNRLAKDARIRQQYRESMHS